MKTRLTLIPLLLLTICSCDKAKDLANKTSSAVKRQIDAKTGGKDAGKADPELEKLVDRNDEGVLFRKDLPFPSRIDVRTTRRSEIAARIYQTSAIDKRSESINGDRIHVSKLERSATQVRYTLEQSSFSVPTKDEEGARKTVANPLEQIAPSVKPITFRKSGNAWKCEDSEGFRAVSLAREIAPVFNELLIENALLPRAVWLGKKRMKPGDQIEIKGELLPMLVAGKSKGTLQLKLDGFEPVSGHPCGVFTITGDFSRKQRPDFEGVLTDEDVTIDSGKVWLSLIHPLVLKEEYDTIQSFKTGGQGGLTGRGQGTIKLSIEREWKGM